MTESKICPRCAKSYDPCPPWRCGCEACGNILRPATPETVERAKASRKREGWKGDRRTRNRVPL